MINTPSPKDRDTNEQDQFLTILSREDALARFEAALVPRAVPAEKRSLADALGCALVEDVVAPIDGGTLLNGEALGKEPVALQDGDLLELAGIKMQFVQVA